MNIVELYRAICDIYTDEFYRKTKSYWSHFLELLLCAEAQGWIRVDEPIEYEKIPFPTCSGTCFTGIGTDDFVYWDSEGCCKKWDKKKKKWMKLDV